MANVNRAPAAVAEAIDRCELGKFASGGERPPMSSASLSTAWPVAVHLLARWREHHERVDELLERTEVAALDRVARARCQGLLFGAVRHLGRIESHTDPLLAKPPRAVLWAVLMVAGWELIEGGTAEAQVARVVHHAVEQAKTLASPPEARLVNAVVRKLAVALAADVAPADDAPVAALAAWYSHPEWLIERWQKEFGVASTAALLRWNQEPATVQVRWRDMTQPPSIEAEGALRATAVEGFYDVAPGHWKEVEGWLTAGLAYVQNPATRLAVDLLATRPGEEVLDLCAAPGGKSVAIADALGGSGRIVAVDLPGPRLQRLKQNLSRIETVPVALVAADVLLAGRELFKEHGLPLEYPAVLVDVPCSNTGVMRHRADVKWRLQAGDFAKHAGQQLRLLQAAARLVAPGGRVVYSTCSLDPEENEQVVAAFCAGSHGGFTLEDQVLGRPWENGHDGAAAFRLRRVK